MSALPESHRAFAGLQSDTCGSQLASLPKRVARWDRSAYRRLIGLCPQYLETDL